ncbi:hypothetical protein HOLleu_15227 [Holothuria leucospilota]|uniref:CCHC-type domain-containing protein n=1 Tax=Holothuria leucospilota TaxID=206669 RepID=A0A9Q1C9H9_HOLLE|nr:hypothetical protein HOLleu_15227 [Holothuria leucospilota]
MDSWIVMNQSLFQEECKYRNDECKKCGRIGYLARQCRSGKRSEGKPKHSGSKKTRKKWDTKVKHLKDKEEESTSDENSYSDNHTSDGQSSWPVYASKVAHETGNVSNKLLLAEVNGYDVFKDDMGCVREVNVRLVLASYPSFCPEVKSGRRVPKDGPVRSSGKS